MSTYREPTDLELRLYERYYATGLRGIGPLTAEQAEREQAYDRYCEEQELEEEARVAAGGRQICPSCARRTLVSQDVCTYGVPSNPNSEWSVLRRCEHCDYKEL